MVIYVTPIKPVFAYRIFTRKKRYDLRKIVKKDITVEPGSRVVLYVTGSVKSFMGEYIAGSLLTGSPDYIIKMLSRLPSSGVGEEDFGYIKNSDQAIAIEVLDPLIYKKPIDMREVLRILPDYHPPLGIQKLDEYEPIVILLFNKARELSINR